MKLAGRNVWLIGASSGIGAALVPALVQQGSRVIITARNKDELDKIAVANSTPERPVLVQALDVTEPGALDRAAAAIEDQVGSIDVLIYGAGQWEVTDIRNWDQAAVERQIAVNYVGLTRAIAAVLPRMLDRRSGDIVGIASVAGYAGIPRAEAYGSTKAAVNALLQSLRIDLKKRGVGVVSVNPGFVDTPLTQKNEFPMPFMIKSHEAASQIIRGLLKGESEIHFPRRLSWPLKLVTALPRPLYERLAGAIVVRDS
jgi:short-subunit dehydrogenase